MRPRVSVIVLTYRHENYIEECLQGVMEQRGSFDLEIVVSDDASPDGTGVAVREMAGRDARIRAFIQDKNLGPAKNFVFAVSQCRGDFIAYCEGDDVWISPEKLSKQLENLLLHDDRDMVYSQYGKIDATGKVIEPDAKTNEIDEFKPEDLIDDHGPSMNSVLMRRGVMPAKFPKAFFSVPNPDVFILAAAMLENPAHLVPGIYSMYRLHGGGIWSGKSQLEKNLIRYSTLVKVFQWLPGHWSPELSKIHDRLEISLITARRVDREMFGEYWKLLPWRRRATLNAKWLYARLFGRQQFVD